jgi:hypothetical protein
MRNVQTMTGQGHFYFSYIRKLFSSFQQCIIQVCVIPLRQIRKNLSSGTLLNGQKKKVQKVKKRSIKHTYKVKIE